MKKLAGALIIAIIVLSIFIPTALAQTDYYVDVGAGDDGNDGLTWGTAWKTITHAANTVPAGTLGVPNTINVGTGTYSGSETFAITFANDYVACIGSGSPTIIDGAGTNPIIEIQATGIRIQDFTIQNGGTAIFASEGGFSIVGNTFSGSPAFDIVKGISWVMNELISSNRTIEDTLISGNTFNVSCDGISMDIYLDGNRSNATIDIGNIDIINNIYNAGAGPAPDSKEGIEATDIAVEYLNGGSVSMGVFTIDNNQFYGGQHAMDFFGWFEKGTDTFYTISDLIVTNNTLIGQANSSAMFIDYYDCRYWGGSSTGTVGDLIITDNTVIAGNSWGIDVDDIGYWADFYDDATVTIGDTIIERNNVNVGRVGINVGWESIENLNTNSSVTKGDLIISSGTVIAGEQGIRIDLWETGYRLADNADCTLGDTYIENNTINSGSEAIDIFYDYVAYEMQGDSGFSMGDYYIRDNNQLRANDAGIYIRYQNYRVGHDTQDSTHAEIPGYVITGNTLDTSGDGVFFYSYSNPDNLSGSSSVDYGGFLIDNNTFSSGLYTMQNGVFIQYEDICEDCNGSSGATIHDIAITNNQFSSLTNDALYMYLNDVGKDFDNNGSVDFGNVEFSANTVNGANNGAYVSIDNSNVLTQANAHVAIDEMEFVGNSFNNINADGVYLYYNLEARENSSLTLGRALVQSGTFIGDTTNSGVYAWVRENEEPGATINFGSVVIDSNLIDGWNNGIYLDGADGASIVGNVIQNNFDGIYIQNASDTFILGNDIYNNGGATSGIHLNDGPGNVAHFNNIIGNNMFGVFSGSQATNAELNRWGFDDSGPWEPVGATDCDPPADGGWNCGTCDWNNDGSGNQVSDALVDYCPWLLTGDTLPGIPSCNYIEGNGIVDAVSSFTGGTMTITAQGGHTICTLKYGSNPAGSPTFTSLGNFWDVYLDRESGVNGIGILFGPVGMGIPQPTPSPTPSPTPTFIPPPSPTFRAPQVAVPAVASTSGTAPGIYYWDGDTWRPCSNQEVIDGYVEVTINNSTRPSLSDLTGQIFADGILVPEQYGGGGPTVGGQVMMIDKAQLVTQWIGLPLRLMLGLAL